MTDERKILEEYVSDGKLMQIATIGDERPWMAHVWYVAEFRPDRLLFTSNVARNHSNHIRSNPSVAGGIVHIELEALGQKVRGVVFGGRASELPRDGIEGDIRRFNARWKNSPLAVEALASGSSPMRLYEIVVDEWVLFDEVNFPEQPRQVIPGDHS